jgi:hypothetical protein
MVPLSGALRTEVDAGATIDARLEVWNEQQSRAMSSKSNTRPAAQTACAVSTSVAQQSTWLGLSVYWLALRRHRSRRDAR